MTGYLIEFDTRRGVLLSRVDPDYPDDRFEEYCNALRAAIAAARMQGPLRFLSDNRHNKIFGQVRAEILWQVLGDNADPQDRLALLVSNSLAKLRSRTQAGSRAETFASENAAYTWLGAGASQAA